MYTEPEQTMTRQTSMREDKHSGCHMYSQSRHLILTTVALAVVTLLQGCMMIQVEQPTVKNYRKVARMERLTPVSVEQLRQMIAADTTHYKVVVLTSSCCGPCEMSMRDTYPKKMAESDTSKVRWIFVEESYSTAQYMDRVFASHHLDHPRYWIDDTLPQYRQLMMKNMWQVAWNVYLHNGENISDVVHDYDGNRLNNIVNAIAPQRHSITGPNGTPTTVMLDPKGHMKCTLVIHPDGHTTFEPTDIRDITVPVTHLDYSHVDTLSYIPLVCTPDGECR